MENRKIIKYYEFLVTAIIILSILPVLYIARYNHPSADDYAYSMTIHYAVKSGAGPLDIIKTAFDTSIAYMQSWQGLYSSAFLLSLQPAVFGEQYYAVTPVVIIVMLYLGTAAFFGAVLKYMLGAGKRPALFVALVIVFYMVQAMPSPCEGLFWFNGAVNYLFFWGIMMCEAALLIRYWFQEKNGIVLMLIAASLSFITSGGNHVTAFVSILFNITGCGFALWKKKKPFMIIPTLAGIIGLIINMTAPGTAVRMAEVGTPAGILDTILHGGYHAFACNTTYMTFSMLMLFAVLTPIFVHIIRSKKQRIRFSFIACLCLILFEYVIIAAMYCIPYYAMKSMGQGRVYDTRFVTYVLFAVITYGYALGCLIDYWSKQHTQRKPIDIRGRYCGAALCAVLFAACYIAVFGGGINSSSTGVTAVGTLYAGYAQQYDEEYYTRLEILEDETLTDAVLPPFSVKPALLFFSDMNTDSSVWPNTKVTAYYGKKSVSLRTEDDE